MYALNQKYNGTSRKEIHGLTVEMNFPIKEKIKMYKRQQIEIVAIKIKSLCGIMISVQHYALCTNYQYIQCTSCEAVKTKRTKSVPLKI